MEAAERLQHGSGQRSAAAVVLFVLRLVNSEVASVAQTAQRGGDMLSALDARSEAMHYERADQYVVQTHTEVHQRMVLPKAEARR